jgi:hypothetical protein
MSKPSAGTSTTIASNARATNSAHTGANVSSKKPAVEQEQINTVVNHREYPAPLSNIDEDPNKTYSVVVIGAGPAGLMLSSALARLGGGTYDILTVDSGVAPTEAGRADGTTPMLRHRSVFRTGNDVADLDPFL